jgi:phage-related protein
VVSVCVQREHANRPLVLSKNIDSQSINLYNPGVKRLVFVGSSLEDLKEFPTEARRAAGFELGSAQRGLDPSDWKPMGAGVREIRIHVLGEWRVLYVAKFAEAIYVLHAFQKKTQKTKREDIELARTRYRLIGDQS